MSPLYQLVTFFLVLFSSTSCVPHQDRYTHYEVIDKSGWYQDDELFFTIPQLEIRKEYTLSLAIRVNRSIPYREIPIGIVIEAPSGKIMKEIIQVSTVTDNIKTGGYNFTESSYMVSKGKLFEEVGVYSYSIMHLSTEKVIKGVIEVGLIIEPYTEK